MASISTEASPEIVFTQTGKNEIRATTITLGVIPKPNQRMSIGAIAITGIACVLMTIGSSAWRRSCE